MPNKKKKFGSSIKARGSRPVLRAEQASLSKNTKRKGLQADSSVTVTGKKKKSSKRGVISSNAKPTAAKVNIKPISSTSEPKSSADKKKARLQKRASKKQLKTTREDRLKKSASRIGEKAKIFAGTKKGDRLSARAKRKNERAAGTRKSAVGTALTAAGRGLLVGAAAAGGHTGKAKWKRSASAKKAKKGTNAAAHKKIFNSFVKPNPSQLTPIGTNMKVLNMAVNKKKENK